MIYLDNAATSFPKPPAVAAAVAKALAEPGSPGRGGYRGASQATDLVARTRAKLAALVGCRDVNRMVFAFNATDALNMAIKGLLPPGAHVVSTVAEHNSVMRPLLGLEARAAITVDRVFCDASGRVDPADVLAAVKPRTHLVVLSHASNVTGALQPIAEIARRLHEVGRVPLMIDGAQTVGCVPIDVEALGIDLLAFAGHKALLGPAGTGGLYVSPRLELTPWREGGTGSDSASQLQPEGYPLHLEAGTYNLPGLAGLEAALDFLADRGVESIRRHELELTRRLLEGLAGIEHVAVHGPGADDRVAVIAFTLEGWDCQDAASVLDETFGIELRAGLHCAPGIHRRMGTFPAGTLRASPGPFSTEKDILALIAAVRDMTK